jgi:Transposase DDE domain
VAEPVGDSRAAASNEDGGASGANTMPAGQQHDSTQQGTGLEVYGDCAYGTGAARAAYRAGGHDTVIKPKPLRPAVDGGYTLDDFDIDEPAGTFTCPAGHTRPIRATRTVSFGKLCVGCPLRTRCTTAAHGRSITLHPHEDLLRAARAQARTPQFKQAYPTRSTVERIIAWTATHHGRRIKLRYLGVTKNHAWLRTRAAAINLRTLINHGLTHQHGTWVLA